MNNIYGLEKIILDLNKSDLIFVYINHVSHEDLIINFDTPNRKVYFSLFPLFAYQMKKFKKVRYFDIRNYSEILVEVNKRFLHNKTSNDPNHIFNKVKKAWVRRMGDLDKGRCFVIKGKKIAGTTQNDSKFDCLPQQFEMWNKLTDSNKKVGSGWLLKFAVDEIGLNYDDIDILYKSRKNEEAWENFFNDCKRENIKREFTTKKSKGLSDRIGLDQQVVKIGRKKVDFIKIAGDFVNGIVIEDPIIRKNRAVVNYEIKEMLKKIEYEKIMAIKKSKPYAWRGFSYSLDSFLEDRKTPYERVSIKTILRPTNHFTFLAAQRYYRKYRKKYLEAFTPRKPIKYLAQSISPAILILIKDKNNCKALFSKRSSRVSTGKNYIALTVDETPKRIPTEAELNKLNAIERKDWLKEYEYDENKRVSDENDGLFFNALKRGANEEVRLNICKGKTMLFAFGIEIMRYLYTFVGYSLLEMSFDNASDSMSTAKDKDYEYDRIIPIPFTIIDIYDFFVSNQNNLCPTTEVTTYYALQHYHGREKVYDYFKNYPEPK